MSYQPTIREMLDNGGTLKIGEFELSNTEVTLTTKDGTYKVFNPIFIDENWKSYETGEVEVIIFFKMHQRWECHRASAGELHPSNLKNLYQRGYTFLVQNTKKLNNFLIYMQQDAQLKTAYQTVGFLPNEPKSAPVFALSQPISQHPVKFVYNTDKIKFDVRVIGNLKNWVVMVRSQVCGYAQLEYILGVSFAAVIIGYFRFKYGWVFNLLTNLNGLSTTGKSTASKLAVSVFGKPVKESNSLYQSFNATENSLVHKLGGNYGVCYALDESSMSKIEDMTALIYTLDEGNEKGRLTDQITVQSGGSWATSILMNGENSILDRTNHNTGLVIRLQEFSHVLWTKDAQHAVAIDTVIQQNYGVAGLAYVEYLSKDWSIIDTTYEAWCEKLDNYLADSSTKTRMATKYALVMTGLELAGKALDIPFDLDAVLAFIQENEKTFAIQKDPTQLILHEVLEDIKNNKEQYLEDLTQILPDAAKGYIRQSHNNSIIVNYVPEKFQEMLVAMGHVNTTQAISGLIKANVIKNESGRQTKRIKANGKDKFTSYELHICQK